MSSFIRKTQNWVDKGLITQQQAQEIIAFEKDRKPFLSLFSIILFLGVFSIACGIAAIVSSNWYSIPSVVKLSGMFLILIAMAGALPMIEKKRPVGFDAGLFFFMLLLFAAIGLVGQVYHLRSDSYKAFLFWSGLAFPLLFLTKRVLFGWIWEIIFVGAVSASPWGERFFRFIFDYFRASPLYFSFLGVVVFFCLFRVRKAALFVVPLRTISFVLGVWFLFCGRNFYLLYDTMETNSIMLLSCVTAFGFAAFVWKYSGFNLQEKQALWIIAGLYALFFLFPLSKDTVYFSELLILIAFIFVAYCFREEKTARVLGVITAFRMLSAFFALFGSLMYTGIGMICSGLMILGIAYGCYKADGYLKQKLTAGGQAHE
ncbi:MAG: DUF2157 domain-containing protein [Alphaproteobacteria bacterium]|nr:DUF2157 domain-containing protein [Alphaproteobacteria bacterium]